MILNCKLLVLGSCCVTGRHVDVFGVYLIESSWAAPSIDKTKAWFCILLFYLISDCTGAKKKKKKTKLGREKTENWVP